MEDKMNLEKLSQLGMKASEAGEAVSVFGRNGGKQLVRMTINKDLQDLIDKWEDLEDNRIGQFIKLSKCIWKKDYSEWVVNQTKKKGLPNFVAVSKTVPLELQEAMKVFCLNTVIVESEVAFISLHWNKSNSSLSTE